MSDLGNPPHLSREEQFSAFIPFCAFKTNLAISKPEIRLSNISLPLCSSFQPKILEGQLCYEINVNQTSGKGKRNELMILLDYQEDLSIHQYVEEEGEIDLRIGTTLNLETNLDVQKKEAKIQIRELSSTKEFGGGIYKISDIKQMTATSAFLNMPMGEKQCTVHSFEDCKTKELLRKCNCVPLELKDIQVVISLQHDI